VDLVTFEEPCWIHLYRSYLMSVEPYCLRIGLALLIGTRCLHVLPQQEGTTRYVDVKYVRFEKESQIGK